MAEQVSIDGFVEELQDGTPEGSRRDGHLQWPGIRPGTIEARPYQTDLATRALKGRTLVVLPTGLGKTVIAALVAGQVLSEERGKVVMVAPTRPLVDQHLKSLTGFLEAEDQVVLNGNLRPSQRKAFYRDHRVIHATPQVLDNDLEHGRIDLEDVALLIVDEAHRAVGEYAYVRVAQALPDDALVLALTASPGGDEDRVDEVTENLSIDHVEARTPDHPDVAPYVAENRVHFLRVPLPADLQRMRALLDQVVQERVEPLRQQGLVPRKPYVGRGDLLKAGDKLRAMLQREKASSTFAGLVNQATALLAIHALELLESQGVEPLLDYLDRQEDKTTKSSAVFLNDPRVAEVRILARSMEGQSHPKLGVLKDVLQRTFAKDPDTLVIVFAQYRDSIRSIQAALEEEGIESLRFVGQAHKKGDRGLSQNEQKEVLQQFRDGEAKVLVASSVAEEGLDVPSVDLVIFYEPVPSEIRLIQRRGRTGRGRIGHTVVLIAEGTRDEAILWSGVNREKRMTRLVRDLGA